MRISKIERDGLIFTVEFTPNWLEKLFGAKPKVKKYKRILGYVYTFGDITDGVYQTQTGEHLGRGSWIRKALDVKRKSW